MTTQEATDELRYAIDLIKQDGKDWLDERDIPVLEMAISALQEQDSPKPTVGSVQNVQNEDLISRKAAIDTLHTWFRDGFDEDRWWNSTHVLAALEGLPSAQPKIGRWIENEKQNHVEKMYHCSECGFNAWGRYEKTKFCGECGVRMENAYEGSD